MEEINVLSEALPADTSLGCLHLEVCQNKWSTARKCLVKNHVQNFLEKQRTCYHDFLISDFEDPFLKEHVRFISLTDTEVLRANKQVIDFSTANLQIHVFHLNEDEAAQEDLEDEELAAASHWILPSLEFQGLWESLIFDSDVKVQLLNYTRTTLLFSDRKVDTNIISWNRVVLLHGPPGTGKTSLCKALAQKLCIHLSDRFSYGQLIEINSHSLFSKWFSESGKLVMKMFQKIQELIDDPEALVCVLIDEVESLTAARKASLSGSEPSDAIRVVNALLTQLDQIKKHPNVLILTTSNITGAIDLAFIDRADIKQYIGPPTARAIYSIYQSCIRELIRAGIIGSSEQLFEQQQLELMNFTENNATKWSLKLWDIAKRSEGLSGRTLRKLPFLAHAAYVQTSQVSLPVFLEALSKVVTKQFDERRELQDKPS